MAKDYDSFKVRYMNKNLNDAYRVKKLDEHDLQILKRLIENETWISDHPFNYKKIPSWVDTEQPCRNYDDLGDTVIPKTYKDFGKLIIKKYFKLDKELTGACLWNGAEDTGWHTDLDGIDTHADKYTMIVYHVPQMLNEKDGGNIMIKDITVGKVENIIPEDGMVLLLKLDVNKYQHCAFKIVGFKDRYTLSFGFS